MFERGILLSRRRPGNRRQMLELEPVRRAGISRLELLLLSALLLSLLPFDLRAQERVFQERADVIVVEVPVQVLRAGEPVRGLEIDDFVVVEGKKRLEIVGLDVVDLTITQGAEWTEADLAELPISGRRHFLMLFDLSFSQPESVLRSRQAAQDLVEGALHPSDLVGVATYSQRNPFDLVINFTSDRDAVREAIQTLGKANPWESQIDPLRLTIERMGQLPVLVGDDPGTPPVALGNNPDAWDAVLLESLRDQRPQVLAANRQQQQSQIMDFTQAMDRIGDLLSNVVGSKHLLLLSEGFDSSAILGTSDEAKREEAVAAAAAGQYWRYDSEEMFGSTWALYGLTEVVASFRRAGAAIQAIDIGGLRTGASVGEDRLRTFSTNESYLRQQGLFVLANETGGELITNYNRLDRALSDLLMRSSLSYLLAVRPAELVADGSWHELDVKVKGAKKGTEVLHRPGYYAPRPFSEVGMEARRLQTAQLLFGGEAGGEVRTQALVTAFVHDDVRARMEILIESAGGDLVEGTVGDTLPIEIYGYAFRPDGTVADHFAQLLGFDLAQIREALLERGLKFWGHLDLGPGDYRLRLLVRNGQTGRRGLSTLELRVPDPTTEPYLSGALFPEAFGTWLLAAQQGESDQQTYPFTRTDDDGELERFLPSAEPLLKSRQLAFFYVTGWGFDSASARLVARLEPVAGPSTSFLPLDLEIVERSEWTSPGAVRLAAELRLESPPPGRYDLVLELSDARLATPITSRQRLRIQEE